MTELLGTRDRLIEAAIEILDTEGEAALRVDRLVKRAGFTKPVLYHHFTDREDVVVQAQTERYRRSLQEGLAVLWRDLDEVRNREAFLARLRPWLASFVSPEALRRRRVRMEILGSAAAQPALLEGISAANRAFVSSLAQYLAIARDRGWLHPDHEPEDLAAWWAVLVSGRPVLELDPGHYDLDTWATITESVLQFLLPE